MYLLFYFLFLTSMISCQSIENGWRGIKPLATDKSSVEKLLGRAEVDDNGYYNYRTEDGFIHMNYSSAPCIEDQYGRGKYNVAKDTVLDYTVHLKKWVKLSDLDFKRSKYHKDTSGNVKSGSTYRNYEDGIDIGVQIQEDTEYVTGFRFYPSKDLVEKHRCNTERERGQSSNLRYSGFCDCSLGWRGI